MVGVTTYIQTTYTDDTGTTCTMNTAENLAEVYAEGEELSKLAPPVPDDIVAMSPSEAVQKAFDDQKNHIRDERNMLLTETDWTQNPDVPESTRTKWQSYRQALRDVPAGISSITDAVNITWPTSPS